jgi:5,10-methylenetetrahydrofolate reductase
MDYKKLIARTEAFVKGTMFDCRSCGQCVLDKTGLVCPMSCPKGLRNGPCGGTLNGLCEVYPDKQCVWVRIHERTAKGSLLCPDLLASPDASLFQTSSYINRYSGRDTHARVPLTPLELGSNRKQMPIQTASGLERVLKQGKFVHTCEIRSPREADFASVRKDVQYMSGHFDAVNATAYLNGKPSLPSARTALELKELGMEPIAQATCRDHTKTSFVAELMNNMMNGVHNVLCLTGDSYAGSPKIKQVFDMDSSLMLYEARFLREHSRIHFTGVEMKQAPRPFLGAAINPFSTPANIPIRRLKQKMAAGADFIQTQLVFDLGLFTEFMAKFHQEEMDRDLFMLVGIPVVISRKACEMMPQVPGLLYPEKVGKSFRNASDIRKAGISFARDMIAEVRELPGVSGVHLMLMGTDHSVLPDVIAP